MTTDEFAGWMIARGYATGHGDSAQDLLKELEWQIEERVNNATRKQTADRAQAPNKGDSVRLEHTPEQMGHEVGTGAGDDPERWPTALVTFTSPPIWVRAAPDGTVLMSTTRKVWQVVLRAP